MSRSASNCPDNNFYGTYSFDIDAELRREGDRPLRIPA
jgi:hypothetical protein